MELVGDFRVMDPIFKGCYGDSLLYTGGELDQLRWWGIHLPPYRGEIPTLSAPSYQQARQPKMTKRSPPRAATPSPPVELPKAKCSGGKGSPHCSSGHSSDTSTLKCPNSTSTKKPSSSKAPTLNGQERSPKVCGSHKHSRSPSPSTKSVRCKQKDVCMEGSHTLSLSAPVPLTALAAQQDHTLMEPSLCLTTSSQPPWVLVVPDSGKPHLTKAGTQWLQSTPAQTSTFPAAGSSNLTPIVPSLAGSHHMLSTWPPGMFTSGPSSPYLTIDQANSIFKLAAECQVLGVKLAKEFQVLSGWRPCTATQSKEWCMRH